MSNPVFLELGQSLTIYQASGPESSNPIYIQLDTDGNQLTWNDYNGDTINFQLVKPGSTVNLPEDITKLEEKTVGINQTLTAETVAIKDEIEEIKTTLNGEDLTERVYVSNNNIYGNEGEVYIDLPTICDTGITLTCHREGGGPTVYWNDIAVTSTPTSYTSTIDKSGEYGDLRLTATFSLVHDMTYQYTRILMLFGEPQHIVVDKVLIGGSIVNNLGILEGKVAELEEKVAITATEDEINALWN
jgi:hypothetical protein